MRAKRRYFNLWQYMCTYSRALWELFKRFSSNRPYTLKEKNISKKYNNQIGCTWDINVWVELHSKAQRQEIIESQRLINKGKPNVNPYQMIIYNKGTKEDEKLCIKLAQKYKCATKELLIRELTCKTPPGQAVVLERLVQCCWSVILTFRGRMCCPINNCLKSFIRRKWLERHIQIDHMLQEGEAITLAKKAYNNSFILDGQSITLQKELKFNDEDEDEKMINTEYGCFYEDEEMDISIDLTFTDRFTNITFVYVN